MPRAAHPLASLGAMSGTSRARPRPASPAATAPEVITEVPHSEGQSTRNTAEVLQVRHERKTVEVPQVQVRHTPVIPDEKVVREVKRVQVETVEGGRRGAAVPVR